MTVFARLLALLVLATVAAFTAELGMSPGPALAQSISDRPFSPRSFWNKQLGDHAPLARNSRRLVRRLLSQTRRYDTWINTWEYSAPVYTVPRDERRVRVTVETPSAMFTNAADAAELQADLASVPIPRGAEPAEGTDRQIVIWQPSTDTMWELWIAHRAPGDPCDWGNRLRFGWHAAWGARIDGVSTHSGRVRAPFGAAASGLPLLGGLIGIAELRERSIRHGLALTIPEVKPGRFVWPATRTDGDSSSWAAIPEGTRFRLDPALRLRRLGLSPTTLAIARAVKRYGLVISDKGGAVAFEAEAPRSEFNPYGAIIGHEWPAYTLQGFPWRRLQALAPPGR